MKRIFPFRVPAPSPSFRILVLGPLLLWLCCLSIASNSEAEVTTAISPTDGTGSLASLGTVITSGTSTVPTNLCSASCVITGGTAAGHNLFHSFGDFNIGASDSARFQTGLVNPLPDANVSNILARITGGPSNLYGSFDSATYYPSANLFLMNPAGFLFGPNATVNVGGMMTFTTADYMRLRELDGSNAGIFRADTAQTSMLASAPVAAFGFIGLNPAAINFEGGQLTVASGTGLALVGGDISLTPDSSVVSNVPSSITAPGMAIQMTSVAGPGEVAADTGIPAAGMALGAVTLGQGTTLSTVGTLAYGDGSGGAVSIRGGQFVATDAKILSSPAIGSTGRGGEVTITTTGSATMTNSTIDTRSQSTNGGGGAVSVAASDLALQDSSIVTRVIGDSSAMNPTAGTGGAVALTGTDSVTLTRSFFNTTTSFSNGSAGAVTVTSPIVTLEDSNILTSVSGNGITLITASGGPVTLGGSETNSVSMTRSAILTASNETEGNSGSVTITGQTIMIGGNEGQQTIVTDMSSQSGDPNRGNAGDIEITGTNVTFTDSAIVQSVADAAGAFSRGGNILVNGSQSVLLDNGTVFSTSTVSQGNSGNVELTSQHVTITGQSVIGSDTFGPGNGGTIKITATQNIALESGSEVTTSAGPFTDGHAGHIELNTSELAITGGSSVRSTTFGSGPGGTFTIQGISGPAESVLISDPGSGVFTDTGSINLDGTIIGTGSGGNIFVDANSVTLQNGGILSAQTTGVGAAGNILVKANSVSLTSGAQLTSNSSIRQTPLFEDEVISPPTGNAGTVTIQGLASPAQSVQIDGPGSGIFTNTQGIGAGGNIFVNANSVTLTNGATVSASSTGQVETPGDAGNIDITATNGLTMQHDSAITTQAGQGASGGNIKVTTAPSATVLLEDSRISASVADGQGGGGNISIDPQYVILLNSQILAQAAQGQGGAITITTNLFLPDANSIVNADSGKPGLNGTVTIQSPNAPGGGEIVPLSQEPLQATSLLNQHCAALAGGEFSSFTVAGRDSLPAEPGGWLASPLVAFGAGEGLGVRSEGMGVRGAGLEIMTLGAPLTGETALLSLRQIAPPGFLTQAFAVDWSTGCTS